MTDATPNTGAPEPKANPLEGAAAVPAAVPIDALKTPRQQALDEIASKQRYEPQKPRDDQGRFASQSPKPETTHEPQPVEAKRFKVKIDGEEREVTEDELLRGYQTAQASQKRFEEAKRLREEALRAVPQQPQQSGVASAQTPSTKALQPVDERTQLARDVSHALAYGSKADIEKAVSRLIGAQGQAGQPGWNPAQTQQIVQYEIRRQAEWDGALRSFETTYEDVTKDPHMSQIALQAGSQFIAEDLAQAGYTQQQIAHLNARGQMKDAWDTLRARGFPMRSYNDMAKHAGETARKWRDDFIGRYAPQQPTQPPADPLARRAAAKVGNHSPPSASAGARSANPPPRQAKSGSDIVAEMRRMRGQA